jgi:hypothetical protein
VVPLRRGPSGGQREGEWRVVGAGPLGETGLEFNGTDSVVQGEKSLGWMMAAQG